MRILVTGPPYSGRKTVAEEIDHECVVCCRTEVEQIIQRHEKFDAAVVVVDAGHLCEGIFSYMTLVEILGIPIVPVLNKMDTIDYCNTQFVAMSQVIGACVPRPEPEWYNGATINQFLERK